MKDIPPDRLRRKLLGRGATLAAIAVGTAIAGHGSPVAAKAAKSEFMYQEHRRDGKGCGDCRFFTPERPNGDVGACSIVEGPVHRDGWCAAFSAKVIA